MINIALIGIGMMGMTHAKAILESKKEIKLVAICGADTDADREKAAVFQCPYYTSVDEMLQSCEVDIVDICTPTFTHEEYVVKAADKGKHVLCEKPFCLTYESARRMVDYCNHKNVKLMVGQVVRFMKEYEILAEYIREGKLGKIRLGFFRRITSRAGRVIRNAKWYDDPAKSGGALFDLMIHDLDFVYSVFGKATDVYAIGRKSPFGCWDEIETNLCFENGARITIESCSFMPEKYPFTVAFRVNGEKGCMEYSARAAVNAGTKMDESFFRFYAASGDIKEIPIETSNDYQREIEYFCNCVAEHQNPDRVPPQQSADVIKIVMAIMESLEENKIVSL